MCYSERDMELKQIIFKKYTCSHFLVFSLFWSFSLWELQSNLGSLSLLENVKYLNLIWIFLKYI